MRYCLGLPICLVILLAAPAAAVAGSPVTSGASRTPERTAAVHRGIQRRSAEVARLQKDVAEQESRSRAAAARLSEQDRALEQLRRQLQAAEAGKVAAPAGS